MHDIAIFAAGSVTGIAATALYLHFHVTTRVEALINGVENRLMGAIKSGASDVQKYAGGIAGATSVTKK